MRRSAIGALALLLCLPAAHAAVPRAAVQPGPATIDSQRVGALSPTLRQWVAAEGRRWVDEGPDVDTIAGAARKRLSGQEYSSADIDTLVQLVLQQCASDAEADLRAALEEMRTANERKKALRELAQAEAGARARLAAGSRQGHDERAQSTAPIIARANIAAAVQLNPVARQPEAGVQPPGGDPDLLGDLSEQQQLRLQVYQDRREKAFEMLSNLMKKQADTASTITSNLK